MEHEQIAERLSEYRDGALGAADRETVSRHLTGCEACAAVLSDWERLSKTFLRRPLAPTPFQTEAFIARVTARLPAEEPAWFARLVGRWLVPALGMSFAALVLSFRPYAGLEVSDPAAALLADSNRDASLALPGPESAGADVLGFGAEDR
jgi:anti-sigma factor RsiW